MSYRLIILFFTSVAYATKKVKKLFCVIFRRDVRASIPDFRYTTSVRSFSLFNTGQLMYHFIATTTPALFRCAMRIGDYWIVHTPRALFGCINNCTLFNMVPKHQPAASHAVCSIHLVSSHLIKLIRKYGLRFEENVYKDWDCGIRASPAQAPT